MQKLSLLQGEAQKWLQSNSVAKKRDLIAFIKKCRMLRDVIVPAILQTQFLQLSISSQTLTPEACEELRWWVEESPDWIHRQLDRTASIQCEIFTDASKTGWGAVMYPGEGKAHGSLAAASSLPPSPQHPSAMPWPATSNWRELHAIGLAIRSFPVLMHNHTIDSRVIVRTDSQTAAAYINREGGPVPHLVQELKRILMGIAWPGGLQLKAVHVAGRDNCIADRLSRL